MNKKKFLARIKREKARREKKEERLAARLRAKFEYASRHKSRVTERDKEGVLELFIAPLFPLRFLSGFGYPVFIPFVPVIIFTSFYLLRLSREENTPFLYLALVAVIVYYGIFHFIVRWRYPGLRVRISDEKKYAIWATRKNLEKPQYFGSTEDIEACILKHYRTTVNEVESGWYFLAIYLPGERNLTYGIYRFSEREKGKVEDFLKRAGLVS